MNDNASELVRMQRHGIAPLAAASPLVTRAIMDLGRKQLAAPGKSLEALWARAFECLRQGMPEEAIQLLDEVIRLAPNNSFAHLVRGQAWISTRGSGSDDYGFSKAIEDFDEAIRIEPDYSSAYEQRGVAWYCKGEYDKAIESFNVAIGLWENYNDANDDEGLDEDEEQGMRHSAAELYFSRGLIWKQKGMADNAVRDFDEAICLNSDHPGCYFHRGRMWFDKETYGEAIDDFDDAIRLESENASAYFWRGLARRRREYEKDDDEAINDFTQAIVLDPQNADTHWLRGLMWIDREESHKAIADFSEAIRLDPHRAYFFRDRGWAWLDGEQFDKAIDDFAAAIRLNPCCYHSYSGRAAALRKMGIAQPSAASSVEINVPGRIFIRPMTVSGHKAALLASTPSNVELASTTLANAHKKALIEQKRYEKLVALNAPKVILENECRLFIDPWKNASHRPEDQSYYFVPDEMHREPNEPDQGLVYLASLTELHLLNANECEITENGVVTW
jgi:tetratricopeptide (TPR) repeat protein